MKRLAAAALVTLALAGVLACALVALRQPASGGDYAAIWGLKARALARSGSLSAVVRVDPTSLASHPEYPPLWPVLLALFSSPAGRYDDLVVTLLWPLLCAASALLCFRATRAATPWRALAASVVALLPFWRVPLTVGYADALLVVLLLAALVSVDTPREGPALFGLFFLAALTKQEGTLAALVAVLLVAVSRRTRSAALGLAGALLGAVPWALWVSAKLPSPPHRDFALAGFDPAKIAAALRALAHEAGPGALAWIAGAALLLALAPATLRRRRGLLAAALLYAGALVLLFGFSVRDLAWHVRFTWERLALVPIALVVPALCEAASEALTATSPARGESAPG